MSPLPVLRTTVAVLRLYLRRLPAQLPWILFTALTANLLAFGGSYIWGRALAGTSLTSQNGLLETGGLGLVVLVVAVLALGLLWRHADRGLLGGEPVGGLPHLRLIAALLFTLAIMGGAAVIAYIVFTALPYRLEAWGLPGSYSTVFLTAALTILYLPLLLRLLLLLPLVALDNQRITVAWRLVLKITTGKTLPLLSVLVLQCLICLPFLWLLRLLSRSALHVSFASSSTTTTTIQTTLSDLISRPQLPTLAGGIFIIAVACTLLAAIQAGTVRHFFGYGTILTPHEHERVLVRDPNEIYALPPQSEMFAPRTEPTPVYLETSDEEDTPSLAVAPADLPVYTPKGAPPVVTAPLPAVTAPSVRPSVERPNWSFADDGADGDPFVGLQPPAETSAPPVDDGGDPFDGLESRQGSAVRKLPDRDEDDPFAGFS